LALAVVACHSHSEPKVPATQPTAATEPAPTEVAIAPAPAMSSETEECVLCHEAVSPGIVEDWRRSLHATTTPATALTKPVAERRISAAEVPEAMQKVVIGCYECHALRADAHKDNFEHEGYKINVVVSPPDCATCHPVEYDQYKDSKKAHAYGNLRFNQVYSMLVEAVTGRLELDGETLVHIASSDATRGQTCYACHGTKIEVKGMREVSLEDGTVVEVPVLTGWPNQGVGRINPDGSRGACTSCHPRHGFSIEVARKPYTCAQCHLDPDVPAWNVYRESKHGNIFLSEQAKWNWNAVPWKVGVDFRAPTCATCHMSEIADAEGEILVPRTHDFGARLWVRLFGLPYAVAQPVHGDTSTIRNKDGLPMPSALGGEPAAEHLIDAEEQTRRRALMSKVCTTCHSTDWTERHFEGLDVAIAETNAMTLVATKLMQRAWKAGLADAANPFDEPIERTWIKQWLFYANSIRYAAAMAGPDYAAFKNGWWYLTANLLELEKKVDAGTKGRKRSKRSKRR
jgi:hypothetical protein